MAKGVRVRGVTNARQDGACVRTCVGLPLGHSAAAAPRKNGGKRGKEKKKKRNKKGEARGCVSVVAAGAGGQRRCSLAGAGAPLEPQPAQGAGVGVPPGSPPVPPGIRSTSAAHIARGASPWPLAPGAQTLDQQ